jgi:hypothetical protein
MLEDYMVETLIVHWSHPIQILYSKVYTMDVVRVGAQE